MEQSDKINEREESAESKVHRHSNVITGLRTKDGKLHWFYNTRNLFPHEDENIEIRFFIPLKDTPAPQKSDALRILLKEMENTNIPWLVSDRKEWAFDWDRMKEEFNDLQEWDWCRGRVYLEPEFEVKSEDVDISNKKY